MKRFVSSMLILLAAVGLAGCRATYQWHQKLTIKVQTPNGEKSNSAVIREKVLYGQLPMSGNIVEYDIVGQATVLELLQEKMCLCRLGIRLCLIKCGQN